MDHESSSRTRSASSPSTGTSRTRSPINIRRRAESLRGATDPERFASGGDGWSLDETGRAERAVWLAALRIVGWTAMRDFSAFKSTDTMFPAYGEASNPNGRQPLWSSDPSKASHDYCYVTMTSLPNL
jgi:hypothetical protein